MLEEEYAKLLKTHKNSIQNDTSKRLKLLQKRLEDMFQLLNLWTQYVEVVYMPESELHVLHTIEKLQSRAEESSFAFRQEDDDIKRRINTLFGSSKDEQAAKVPGEANID